ncbi:MAG: hypothetical protein ACJAZO_004088 [Myxococcota bacterium]|jgi:hypothetical protein
MRSIGAVARSLMGCFTKTAPLVVSAEPPAALSRVETAVAVSPVVVRTPRFCVYQGPSSSRLA